ALVARASVTYTLPGLLQRVHGRIRLHLHQREESIHADIVHRVPPGDLLKLWRGGVAFRRTRPARSIDELAGVTGPRLVLMVAQREVGWRAQRIDDMPPLTFPPARAVVRLARRDVDAVR